MMHNLLPDMDEIFLSHGINEITIMGLLRVATQDMIHKLSSQVNVQIDVDLRNGVNICKSVDREEFEEVNRGVFERCESLIKQCLCDAKVVAEDVNDVILVGGCSNIPKVRDNVKRVCKRSEFYSGINPFEAAVHGAALEGAVASEISDPLGSLDLLTIQVTPLSIGIRADGGKFIPIICRNITMPARRELFFTTAHDNQLEALILVYEGDEKAEKNHLLGYFKITGIPPAPKGVPEINVYGHRCFKCASSPGWSHNAWGTKSSVGFYGSENANS